MFVIMFTLRYFSFFFFFFIVYSWILSQIYSIHIHTHRIHILLVFFFSLIPANSKYNNLQNTSSRLTCPWLIIIMWKRRALITYIGYTLIYITQVGSVKIGVLSYSCSSISNSHCVPVFTFIFFIFNFLVTQHCCRL